MAKPTPRQRKRLSFYTVITQAVADMVEHGYDDISRVEGWVRRIRQAAEDSLTPLTVLTAELTKFLKTSYTNLVDRERILQAHPGVARFTLNHVKPQLRAELDRRIVASANLIRLNRQEAIEGTLRRFEGWSTSIPKGGSKTTARNETKDDIRKAMSQLPFEERRVIIDQGHKFVSSLNSILASDGKAIAGKWHSHWRQRNYNYREDHKERDDEVYAMRGNWALEKGLMNKGAGYTDEITQPGEEVYCRCYYEYIYNLADLPSDMITNKGKYALETAKKAMAA